MIYIVCFIVSVLLFYSARNNKTNTRILIEIIALLIPCIIAGLRASTVGTDVTVYLEPMVENARSANNLLSYLSSSWKQGWVTRGVSEIEIGFSLLVYCVIKVFGSIYFLQFVLQLLVIVPIYLGLKEKKEKNIWLGMLVYFCMFYNNSLNIMRQAIAMAFIFLAFQYLFNEKKKKFILTAIIACSFHNIALLGIVVLFVYEVLKKSRSNNKGRRRLLLLICLGVAIIVLQNLLGTILNRLGLSYYTRYLIGDISFMPNQVIVRLPILILCFFLGGKALKEQTDNYYFNICCIFYTIIFAQFSSVNSYAYRIAMIFSFFLISFLPEISSVKSKIVIGDMKIKFNTIYIISYLIIWWIYYCVILVDSTMPYSIGMFQ